jgi:hypothetical protein
VIVGSCLIEKPNFRRILARILWWPGHLDIQAACKAVVRSQFNVHLYARGNRITQALRADYRWVSLDQHSRDDQQCLVTNRSRAALRDTCIHLHTGPL